VSSSTEGAVSLRKRLSRFTRHYRLMARTNWPLGRLSSLRDSKRGRRAFLLGNGPSLRDLDLGRLAGEDVCVVNMGVRALENGLPNVAIHVVIDKNRYLRFADEIEDFASRYGIPLRFFGIWVKSTWRRRRIRAQEPYYLFLERRRYLETGFREAPQRGYGNCGTVIITALQILYYLGYREVYVAGVDLNYSGEQTYFYDLGSADRVHEADPLVQQRRPLMNEADAEFALALAAYERDGRKLVNVGAGGKLAALPREDYNQVLARPGGAHGGHS